jgi:hypothetical protein
MEYPRRIHFETNVDDLVDATMRYWKRAKAGRSQRRRGVLGVAAAFTTSLFGAALISSGAAMSTVAPLAIISFVLGAAFWPLYGRLYDGGFQRRLRRVMREEAGTETSWTCEIELRNEGAWSRSRGVEILFGWHDVIAIEDTDDVIEFHFRGGFMVARSKAFQSSADRGQFLEIARSLAAA